jgi:hypothetical protein
MSLRNVRICVIDPNYVDAPNSKLKYGYIMHNNQKDLPAMTVSIPSKQASLDLISKLGFYRVIIAQEFKVSDFV